MGTARSVCALAAAAAVVWDVRLQETCGVGSGRGGGALAPHPQENLPSQDPGGGVCAVAFVPVGQGLMVGEAVAEAGGGSGRALL